MTNSGKTSPKVQIERELDSLVNFKLAEFTEIYKMKNESFAKFKSKGHCYRSYRDIQSCQTYMADLKSQLTEIHESGDTNSPRIPKLIQLYQDAEHNLELHELDHEACCIVYETLSGESFEVKNVKTTKSHNKELDRILSK